MGKRKKEKPNPKNSWLEIYLVRRAIEKSSKMHSTAELLHVVDYRSICNNFLNRSFHFLCHQKAINL